MKALRQRVTGKGREGKGREGKEGQGNRIRKEWGGEAIRKGEDEGDR